MPDHNQKRFAKPHLWLIALVGVIVARRLAARMGSGVAIPRVTADRMGQARLAKQIRIAATQRKRVLGRAGVTAAQIGAKVSTQVMFTKIPPAAAGGLFSPKLPRTRKILRNPTGGSRWIVQSQALFPVIGRAGWD